MPVPVARRIKPDPWAHRRGEPRVFAFLWAVYLLLITLGLLASMAVTGAATMESYRHAARIMLGLVAIGIGVLWPMTRLSQLRPAHPSDAAIRDAVVILVPVQAIIWPQWWLAGWPLGVVAALACLLSAWTILTGAAVVTAQCGSRAGVNEGGAPGGRRATWMVVCVLLLGLGPLALAIWPRPSQPSGGPSPEQVWLWMTSPLTGIYEVTRDRFWAGTTAVVGRAHWVAIGATALAGAVAWSLARVRCRQDGAGSGAE